MDQTPQVPQPAPTPVNQPTSPQQPLPKAQSQKMLPIFITLFIVLLLGAGGYFFWMSNNTATENPGISPTPTTVSQEPTPSSLNLADSGIPITTKTVSFTRVNDEVFLRYKGKFYSQEAASKNDATLTKLPNPDSYTWYGLVDAPEIPADSASFDEVFDFSTFPNNNNFIFIMRWPTAAQANNFKIFYYDLEQPINKVSTLFSFVASDGNTYNVPRIKQISMDGRYVAFDMFGCWNCGGHAPDVMLYDMQTKKNKRIGVTSSFAWKENGNYEYKVYKAIPCPADMEGPGECSEDPTKLPLLTGKM